MIMFREDWIMLSLETHISQNQIQFIQYREEQLYKLLKN